MTPVSRRHALKMIAATLTAGCAGRAGGKEGPTAAGTETNRTLYFHVGSQLSVGGRAITPYHRVDLRGGHAVELDAGPEEVELLLLQGRPIGEPVVTHGPFVMNTAEEIRQTFTDFRRTGFGGWPWPRRDPVNARDKGRFARHADGKVDRSA